MTGNELETLRLLLTESGSRALVLLLVVVAPWLLLRTSVPERGKKMRNKIKLLVAATAFSFAALAGMPSESEAQGSCFIICNGRDAWYCCPDPWGWSCEYLGPGPVCW